MSNSSETINHDTSDHNYNVLIAAVIIIGVLLTIVFIGSYFYFIGTVSNEQIAKQNTGKNKNLAEIQLYEQETLSSFDWVDKSKRIVKVPINFAMSQIGNEYNK